MLMAFEGAGVCFAGNSPRCDRREHLLHWKNSSDQEERGSPMRCWATSQTSDIRTVLAACLLSSGTYDRPCPTADYNPPGTSRP